MVSHTQRDPTIIQIISFEGARESPLGVNIPLIELLIRAFVRAQLTTIKVPLNRDTPVEGRRQRPKAFVNFG